MSLYNPSLVCLVARIKGLTLEQKRIKNKIKILPEKDAWWFLKLARDLAFDSRHCLLAYGFARDVPYKNIERKSKLKINKKKLLNIVQEHRFIVRAVAGFNCTIVSHQQRSDERMMELIDGWLNV